MSHYSDSKSSNYECSGPRPPIPGQEETRRHKIMDSQSEIHLFMASTTASTHTSSSPSCLKWARTLSSLLEDRDGVELFKKYVESEGGIHSDRLKFYFACEGLKQQNDPDKMKQIIGAIYRFLRKSELQVPEDIKKAVKAGLKDEMILTPDLYDQMQQDVERIINDTTYPNFLQSEMYLQHVRDVQSALERNSQLGFQFQQPHAVVASAAAAASNSSSSASVISDNSTKYLSRSSTLPTLHEESELLNITGEQDCAGSICDSSISNRVPNSNSKLPMSLTKDALMATQRRRLEQPRPPGAHGYSVYTYSSYNPVSRRDSELTSLSSGRTDSDTMSISSLSTDGRPQRRHHHHHSSLERKMIRENVAANNEIGSLAIIPRTQRLDMKLQAISQDEFLQILIPKLEVVKKDQDRMELLNKKLLEVEASDKAKSSKLLSDAIRERFMDDDDDQDILDQHVSRVWSDMTPHRSPGTLSPSMQFGRRKPQHEFSAGTSTQSSMRNSKSMPESANMRKFMGKQWGSMNTDSGISLVSSETLTKHKESMSMSMSSSCSSGISKLPPPRASMLPPESVPPPPPHKMTLQLDEFRRKQMEDEARRSKRYTQQPPQLPQKNVLAPPPIPAKSQFPPEATTTVVYSFCDEDVPYRIKIPGRGAPTLKQFKDYLPKKGNYRFFFKTRCDDDDNPIIQEEMNSDSDVLPLFEGKVMATVKIHQ